MLLDIPEDIWSEVIEWLSTQARAGRSSINNLALTSKRLRNLAIPILYRSLKFDMDRASSMPSHAALVALLREDTRVSSLYRAPHLLRHVRELDVISRLSTDLIHGFPQKKSKNFKSSIEYAVYESLLSLMSQMSELRHVEITHGPITPQLHSAIFSHVSLNSVRLCLHVPQDVWEIPEGFSGRRNILHLDYSASCPKGDSYYFSRTLEQCSPDLQTLKLYTSGLPCVIRWASNRALSLRTLQVCCFGPRDSKIWELLPFCPELTTFSIYGKHTTPSLPGDVVPKLEWITIPAGGIAPVLTCGRPVHTVHMRGSHSHVASVTEMVGPSTVHLRRLSISFDITSHEDIITFLQSLSIYPSLAILRIILNLRNPFSVDQRTREGLRDQFSAALRQLPQLRSCNIVGGKPNSLTADPSRTILCPISSQDEYNDRGHPLLDGLHAKFLDDNWWTWVHPQGWTCMQNSYEFDWSYEVYFESIM